MIVAFCRSIAASIIASVSRSLGGPPPLPRRFHARVSLFGHRNLGLCLVEEVLLAREPMLRLTVVGADVPPMIQSPRSVFQMSVLDAAAVAEEMARAEREVRSDAERMAREAERTAAKRAARADHDVEAVRYHHEVVVRVGVRDDEGDLGQDGPLKPAARHDLLSLRDEDVARALDPEGMDEGAIRNVSRVSDGCVRVMGAWTPSLGSGLCAALYGLGFRAVRIRHATSEELTAMERDDIPF